MWQGNNEDGAQWRGIAQFMRFLGNFSGQAPKAIGAANPDEPIKLKVRVKGQNRKFVFPILSGDNIGTTRVN